MRISSTLRPSSFFVIALALAACSDSTTSDSGIPSDSGARDAGPPMDGTPPNPDAEPLDAAAPDAVAPDADAPDAAAPDAEEVPVAIQLISISDWHAQLDPLSATAGTSTGGAAALSAHFQRERAANPNTIVVTAGDAFGASPPLSGFFEERPAVLAMNLMGIDVDTFGNHNFDRGLAHLQQMIDLADFEFVSSNLDNLAGNLTGVASPFHIVEVGGVKVAFIGVTNPDAPMLLFPGQMGTVTITNPAAAADAAREAARAQGATVFVILAHLGATIGTSSTTWGGPLIEFARALNGYHVIFGDHTDRLVDARINDQIVVENRSKGLTYARVELSVFPSTGDVSSSRVTIVYPRVQDVTPDPAVIALLDPYRQMLSAQLDGVIGTATGMFNRGSNIERLGEVPIGNLIADAIRVRYGSQLALTNSGGIRAPIPSSYLPANTMLRRPTPGYAPGPPYDVVLGDAHAVLPFGNAVVTRTVTGAQLWAALEHSVSALPAANGRFGQISGFSFTFSVGAPAGMRVQSVTLDGGAEIMADSTVYTMSTIDFINAGGDGYTMLADGEGTTRDLAVQALADHIQTLGTVTPTIEGRITQLP